MYSYSTHLRQMSAGMSGGVIIHDQGITIGQKTGENTALVSAPGISSASVGSWPGIRTDFRGYTLASYLTPYQENVITLRSGNFSCQRRGITDGFSGCSNKRSCGSCEF